MVSRSLLTLVIFAGLHEEEGIRSGSGGQDNRLRSGGRLLHLGLLHPGQLLRVGHTLLPTIPAVSSGKITD